MVLTKEELIAAVRNEVRLLLHLTGKIDPAKLDYRPGGTQRSTLELLQYLAIAAPVQIAVIRNVRFTRAELGAAWGPAEAKAKTLNFDQAIAAIREQADECARSLDEWTDAEFRGEIDVFGAKFTRGAMLVNQVLAGYAAYRMQLFCYLKSCGREELNTVNLWYGADSMSVPAE